MKGAAALLLGVFCGAACHAAPLRFGGHTYRIVSTPATWAQARKLAAAAGGHLAIVDSAKENAFLFQALEAAHIRTVAPDGGGARYAWLGASDAAKEGDWRWVDGKRVAKGYANWGHGPGGREPDDFGGRQDCMAMGLTGWPAARPGLLGRPGQWNDVDGGNRLAFVIEFETSP